MPKLFSLAQPPPSNWQDFEDICLDLWRRKWADPTADKHGSGGQAQDGVDIFGSPDGGSQWEGVQCKLRAYNATLTQKEIETAVERATTFKPALCKLLIATTARRHKPTQEIARKISVAQREKNSFPVSIVFWDEIWKDLAVNRDLIEKHYPDYLVGQAQAWTQVIRQVVRIVPLSLSILISLVFASLRLLRPDVLFKLGLSGSFYYLVLVSLGLAVALSLLGTLRSVAWHSGWHRSRALMSGVPIVGFSLVILGGLLSPQAVNPSVAVLTLTDCSNYGQGFAVGFSTMLSAALEAGGGLRVINRQRVFEAERDLVAGTAGRLDRFGRHLDTEFVVSASCGEAILGSTTVTVGLDVDHTSTPLHFKIEPRTGTIDHPLNLASELASDVRVHLSLGRISPEQQNELGREFPAKKEALARYFDGIVKLEALSLDEAQDSFNEALKFERHPKILWSLARVLMDLGLTVDATNAIQEAAGLAEKRLSLRDQLEIAALRWEIEGDWESAAAKYGELLRMYPQELRYALALAEDQEPINALERLDRLRGNFTSSADLARIDIKRADLLHDLGRYSAARSVAEQAKEEAEASFSYFLKMRAAFLLALIDSSVGRHAEARSALRSICRYFERTPGTYFVFACREALVVESIYLGKSEGLADLLNDYEASRDFAGQGRLLLLQSEVAVDRGDFAAAERFSDQALKIFQDMGDDGHEQVVDILAERANLFYAWGKPIESKRYFEKAYGDYERLAQTSKSATSIEILAEILYYQGLAGLAEDRQRAALTQQCREHNLEGASYDKFRLGMIYGMKSDPAARAYLEDGIAEQEQPVYKAEAILGLGSFEIMEGNPSKALKLAGDAERLLPDPQASLWVRARLLKSWAFLELGKIKDASRVYNTVRATVRMNRDFRVHYESEILGARLTAASGRPQDIEQAISALAKSAEHAEEAGYVLFSLEARLVRGQIALYAGEKATFSGRRELQRVALEAEAMRLTQMARRAERLLGRTLRPLALSSVPPPPSCTG